MNITPTHVTFEQAKLINYPFLTNTGYSFDGNILIRKAFIATNGWINRPEQWQVVEWLRVNHGIWVYCEISGDRYYCKAKKLKSNWRRVISGIVDDENTLYNNPQDAYSAAFDYILNNNLI
jgi:hypothetical protein